MGHNLEKNLRKIQGLRERGQLEKALRQLQDWAKKYPDAPHYLYEAAMVAFDLEDFSTGITSLKTLLRTIPDTREKVIGACGERYHEKPALPLAEFLIENHIADGLFAPAMEVVELLDEKQLDIYVKKANMRHQSLVATPNTQDSVLLGSHAVQLVIAHGRRDGPAFGASLEALAELDPSLLETLSVLARTELADHPDPARIAFARGLCLCRLGQVADGAEHFVDAARQDETLLGRSQEEILRFEPEKEDQGIWWRARGELSLFAHDGKQASEAFLQAADSDPLLREQILSLLKASDDDSSLDAREEILKLRLRLLVVLERHDEVADLAHHLREDGTASPQELRVLMGEGQSGEGLPSQMIVALAETALHDRDLPAAASHINEIPAHDEPSLNKLLRTIGEVLPGWGTEGLLQLRALQAVLQARVHDAEATNLSLAEMWAEDSGQVDTLFQVTHRCLDLVAPRPELIVAMLPVALDASRDDEIRPLIHQILGEDVKQSSTEHSPLGGVNDERSLDFDLGGSDSSPALSEGLIEILGERPDLAEGVLELLDSLDRKLGTAQSLRYPVALAALLAERYERALPEFSVLLMAEPQLGQPVLAHLRESLDRNPEHADLNLAAADLMAEQGEIEEAASCLGRALRADPSRAEDFSNRFEELLARSGDADVKVLWTEYADALFHSGRFDQLAEVCEQASQRLDARSAGYFHVLRARMLVEEGRLSQALQAIQKGMVEKKMDLRQATAILEEILAANPSSSIAFLLLGQASAQAGQIEKAINSYVAAVRIDNSLSTPVGAELKKMAALPQTTGAHLVHIADYHAERGDPAAAAQTFDRALRMEPDLADRILGELGVVLGSNEGNLDLMQVGAVAARVAGKAGLACELLIRIDQRDPARFEMVLAEMRRVRESVPDDLLPVRGMARVLLAHQAPEAAAQTVADAGRLDEYSLDGRVDMLQEFHERMPHDSRLTLALSDLLHRKGATDSALELLQEAMDNRNFEPETAITVIASMLEDEPEHPDASLLQHDLLVRVGRVDEALRTLPDPIAMSDFQQPEISERLAAYPARTLASRELTLKYARSLMIQGRTVDAIDALRRATERTEMKASNPLFTELARLLHQAGQVEESRQILARQCATVEDERSSYQLFEQWNRDRLEAEIAALDDRCRNRPQAAHLWLKLAEKLIEAGRPERVLEILRAEAPEGEWRMRRACLLARAHLELGCADLAEAVLLSAVDQSDPSQRWGAELRYRLAQCADLLGRPAESHARYLQLIDDPEFGRRAAARARQSYGHYLQDVAGEFCAVATRMSSL